MFIQEFESRAEAMHAAQHQGMVGVVFRFCSHGPAPLQELQCSFSAQPVITRAQCHAAVSYCLPCAVRTDHDRPITIQQVCIVQGMLRLKRASI